MTTSDPSVRNSEKAAAFVLAALASAAAMRLLVRTHPAAGSLSLGLLTMTTGIVMAWIALRKWRGTAPMLCATVVGVSGGLAGAGIFILLTKIHVISSMPAGPISQG